MPTTIQVSEKLQKELARPEMFDEEPYEDVIWDLMEDSRELDGETKKEIDQARQEIKDGKYHTLEEVKKEFGILPIR
ncbi:hypothetical protein B1B_18016 [mine drainage metagenome]|uniref:Uncharacterized protein n=1 Tax=mine drainage metagenome TaxID=410659 RepID=T0YEX9_9ZZZZ